MSTVLAASLIGGCGGEGAEPYGAEGVDVAETGEAINRGTLVSTNNAPYSSVVRLSSSEGICSAIKLTDDRYLTAAHCLRRANCTYVGALKSPTQPVPV